MGKLLKVCGFFGADLLAFFSISGQSRPTDQPLFQTEITKADSQGHPTFTVKNVSGKALVAAHIEFPWSSGAGAQTMMDWDPIAQGRANDPRLGPIELQAGDSVTLPLPHLVDEPLPDKVDIVAGIWSDGQTFGDAEWTKRLVNHRAALVTAYEQSISILQEGLAQNWNRDQYSLALGNLPTSFERNALPFITVRSNLQSHQDFDANPESRRLLIQNLVATFSKNVVLLRSSAP